MMSNKKQRAILVEKVQNVNEENFGEIALQVFQFQAENNPVYARYLSLLNVDYQEVINQ